MNPVLRQMKKHSPSSGQNSQLVLRWLLVHSGWSPTPQVKPRTYQGLFIQTYEVSVLTIIQKRTWPNLGTTHRAKSNVFGTLMGTS
jgi:hypothetical protein